MNFKLISDFKPTGDQPKAISELTNGINENIAHQTLLGVTGSGKTFTVANIIEKTNKPTLILSHNKTLAAQLYGEFKQFFPKNIVEYFVSYYDYYQPEAYLPVTGTYIEKDLSINDEIEKLRLAATSALLSKRNDVIIVSSVSCIYGMSNPDEFSKNKILIKKGQILSRNKLLFKFVENLYSRAQEEFKRGTFRVKGDIIDIYLAYSDNAIRIDFFGDEIEAIFTIDPTTNNILEEHEEITIYPANIFVTNTDSIKDAIDMINKDMNVEVESLRKSGKIEESNRLKERTSYDIEMIRELGYCSGIENYSRYFDRRKPGQRPFCLLDYFPNDFLIVIDESHVTIPQIKAMYGGDKARKTNLVDYGFRLKSAMDNRPLKFEEFEMIVSNSLYVSATPSDYELEKSEGFIVEQIIRPTGLLDPVIEVRPTKNQIDNLIKEIHIRIAKKERTLITTLTKRMAEELHKYLNKLNINSSYIHSEIDTLDRVEILRKLRLGVFDVLVGVNLLREGLDLPEVSLIAIMDADKEGFLRNQKSLVQTVGRAARNINGFVIMYADKITYSMELTINETNRRRKIQEDYNTKNKITPTPLITSEEKIINSTQVANKKEYENYKWKSEVLSNQSINKMNTEELEKKIINTKKEMKIASKNLDFIEAARLRDVIFELEKLKK
ncbi:MAG: excinuclease ABC subunit B [Crocinitomicaceae bacterium]|nr:excinuclease ABC subunit B [Crocinitomicaceae bacterium]